MNEKCQTEVHDSSKVPHEDNGKIDETQGFRFFDK